MQIWSVPYRTAGPRSWVSLPSVRLPLITALQRHRSLFCSYWFYFCLSLLKIASPLFFQFKIFEARTQSFCLCILNSRIIGTHHHAWLLSYSLLFRQKSGCCVLHLKKTLHHCDAVSFSFLPAPNRILNLSHLFFPCFFFQVFFWYLSSIISGPYI